MPAPELAELLVLTPKGAPKKEGGSPRRARTQAALKAAFKAARDNDEAAFLDAMEGAIGFGQSDGD